MTFNLRRNTSVIILAVLLSSCSSMKLPDMDFIKFPEFKEEAENIPDYPDVTDAAEKPTDLRTDEQWDKAAETIIEKRDDFANPDLDDPKTDAEIIREMQDFGNDADAYKEDDPE